MELRNLITFTHVAELGSFTRAAELHTRKGKAKGAKIPMAAFLHDYYNIAGQEMQIIPVRLLKKYG